jgi:hypothetical protein
VPTYDQTNAFRRDWNNLRREHRQQFLNMLPRFVACLKHGRRFDRELRVKPVRGSDGVYEVTWEGYDGRATFQYGREVKPGEKHIIWRRIGTHDIFREA